MDLAALLLALSLHGAAAPQTDARPAPRARAQATQEASGQSSEAYLAYLRGHRLEGQGDVEKALEAYKQAAKLDPSAAEPRAALAELYVRENQAKEALTEAQAALAIDNNSADAHWVLGIIFAASAEGRVDLDSKVPAEEAAAKAIEHFETALPARGYDYSILMSLGRLYLKQGDNTRAIERLSRLVRESPGIPQASMLLAEAYEGTGDRVKAIETLEELLQEEPGAQAVAMDLARLYERERRWKDAAQMYDGLIAQNPKSIDMRLRRATALMNSGDARMARDMLEEIAKENPTEASALYLLADAELRLKNFEAAEQASQQLVALEPKSMRGPYLLAQIYGQRHEYKKVIDLVQPLLEGSDTARSRSPQAAALAVHLGFAHQELGDFDAAIAAFERARSLSSPDTLFDVYLVQTELAAGKYQDALTRVERAREQSNDDPRLIRLHAQSLWHTGQQDKAVSLLTDAAREQTGEPSLVLTLASLYSDAAQYGKAETVLQDAARTYPRDPAVPFQLGAVLEQQKQFDRAEQAFRQALALDPGHAPTLNYLGYMFAERGQKLDEALTLLQRALELDPDNGSYLDSLGWAYFKMNQLDKAREYLARAAQQLGRNSVVQDHFGDLLHKIGDRSGAVSSWQRALAGDGESIDRGQIEKKIRDAQRGAK